MSSNKHFATRATERRVARSRLFGMLSLAFACCLWSASAFADCTIDNINACTRADPLAAKQVLLGELAKSRTPALLFQMAQFYRTAPAPYRDVAQSYSYMQRAANAGSGQAMMTLADMFMKGDGMEASPRHAIELLEMAAKVGQKGPAMRALGEYYLTLGDKDKAQAAFEQAGGVGDARARKALAALQAGQDPTTDQPPAVRAKPARQQVATTPPPAVGQAKVIAAAEPPKPEAPTPPPAVEEPPMLAEASPPEDTAPVPAPADQPSTQVGNQLTIPAVIRVAYEVGFRTEDQLLAAVATAVAESSLWTGCRNWQPEKGYRPASDVINVVGPRGVWSSDGRQMHSDRGLWQISSFWWSKFSDDATDNPVDAAAAAFEMSDGGTDFMLWNSYATGEAQKYYDQPHNGWPPLRVFVKRFLLRTSISVGNGDAARDPG